MMNNRSSKRKIVFVISPKVHLLDLSGPAHVFYEAKEAGVNLDILFVGISDDVNIQSSAGLFFSNLSSIDELTVTPNDFIIVPGSENILDLIKTDDHFLSKLNDWHNEGVNICSICVGVFWLAEAGLLKHKRSTTHWRYQDRLKQLYPETIVQEDNLFVIEDNLYMSAGVSAGIDLSLHIIEILFGHKLAIELSKEIVYYFRRSGSDPQLSKFLKYRNHSDSSIHRIQDYIMNHLNEKFTLDDLASEVHMSKRNMSRKFKAITHLTIGEYIKVIKIERAKHLLSKGNKMKSVALECGYRSINQLKDLLKQDNM
ncbi:MAG: DJ-1/PfpI family protein [Bacteroidota bacterium]